LTVFARTQPIMLGTGLLVIGWAPMGSLLATAQGIKR